MTRVSLNTSTSPRRSRLGRSRTARSEMASPSTSSSRAESRGRAGLKAMRSWGSSKSKSATPSAAVDGGFFRLGDRLRAAGAGASACGCAGTAATAPGIGPSSQARTILVGLAGGSPGAMVSTNCMPEITRPKPVYLWSSVKLGARMMKNWLLALFGSSARAMDMTPRRCGRALNSAGRLGSGESPEPVPVGSPPWAMKPGMTRWKMVPL